MSDYLMKPIKDNEDLKGALRKVNNVQKGQKRPKW